jgi:hypothetical protein
VGQEEGNILAHTFSCWHSCLIERMKKKVLNFLNEIQLKKVFSSSVKYIDKKFCMRGPGGGNKDTYIS